MQISARRSSPREYPTGLRAHDHQRTNRVGGSDSRIRGTTELDYLKFLLRYSLWFGFHMFTHAQRQERVVYDVVSCQLEVWWEVVPLRFVVQPSVMPLLHSRRVTKVTVAVSGVQLWGVSGITAQWTGPSQLAPALPCELHLSPTLPTPAQLRLTLQPQADDYPVEDIIE